MRSIHDFRDKLQVIVMLAEHGEGREALAHCEDLIQAIATYRDMAWLDGENAGYKRGNAAASTG